MQVPSISLANGDQLPALGLGTYRAAPGEVGAAVLSAIQLGYRHFDCAAIYGNEKEIGEAFREAFASGLVTREEIWVTSKLWNDSHAREQVLPALQQTLADLQLDYLDLYLIHWPIALRHGTEFPESGDDFLPASAVPLTATWQAMEDCFENGLTRHIGVSNFSAARLENLIAVARHRPEVNQVECHPLLNQWELLEICQKHHVVLTAYAPLRSARPKEGNEAQRLATHPVLQGIAEAHEASPQQVALAWALIRGTVAIPKSTHSDRQKDNLAAAAVRLTGEEMDAIDQLDCGYRHIDGSFWTENGSPYTLAWLWQEGDLG